MARVSVSIDVPSLDKAELFYCKALGCTKLRDPDGHGFCLINES